MSNLDTTLDFSALPDVTKEHPELEGEERVYAAHMLARELAYEAIFGESDPPSTILTPDDPNLMINWPGGGVYAFPPRHELTGWHYVTHGLAQPLLGDELAEADLDGEEPVSGWGIELVISTPEKCYWAPHVLLNMTKYLLFQPNSRVILPGDRLPCNGPLVLGTDTSLRHLIAVRSPEYPSNLHLPAGYCWLVHLIGATDDEIGHAQSWGHGQGGTLILYEVFQRLGVGCLSDPDRTSITESPQFHGEWERARELLESQWREEGWNGEGKAE